MAHTNTVFSVDTDARTSVAMRERLVSGEDPRILLAYASMPTLGLPARTEILDLLAWSGLEPMDIAYALALMASHLESGHVHQVNAALISLRGVLRQDPTLRDLLDAAMANTGWTPGNAMSATAVGEVGRVVLIDALGEPARQALADFRSQQRDARGRGASRPVSRSAGRGA